MPLHVGGWASRAARAAADARNGEEVSGGSGGGGGRAVTGGEDGGTGAAAGCLGKLVAALASKSRGWQGGRATERRGKARSKRCW